MKPLTPIRAWQGALLALLAAAPGLADPGHDATLLAYVEVWSGGDLERLDTLVSADYRRHGGPDEACSSRDDLKDLIRRTRTIYQRLRLTAGDYVTDSDGGALRGSFYGVHSEIGRVVEFEMMSMVRFEDGRIAEEWTLGNNFLVLVGLGYQLTPPGFEVVEKEPADDPEAEPGEDG